MLDFRMSNQGFEHTVAKITILGGTFVKLRMNILITEEMINDI